MYKDIEAKFNYHKERIIRSFIKQGIYPNNDLIQSKLNSIELRLSIFKKLIIKEGAAFNTREINEAIKLIYDDLTILYDLLYKITIIEYNNLNQYIQSHLNELQEVSDIYLKKAELETYSTALGKTILFKHNKFNIDKKENIIIIDLGEIEVNEASNIICMAKINNLNYSNIMFKLTNNTNEITSNAYNYNHDIILIPGESSSTSYEYNFKNEQKINGLIELPIRPETLVGSFMTLGGKDKVLYKKANEHGEVIDENTLNINELSFNTHSYIDFYVVNGTSISFRFNKKPISTNFNVNSNKIENLNKIHHFFIECDSNFSFDFELEKGSIYAFREKTIIERKSLYYSGNIDVKDFLVIQTYEGKPTKYKVQAEIYNSNIAEEDIEGIIIKKI